MLKETKGATGNDFKLGLLDNNNKGIRTSTVSLKFYLAHFLSDFATC